MAAVALLMCMYSLRPLTILHHYPESGNYSYVKLTCLNHHHPLSGLSPSVVSGARFQLNGTFIGEEEMVLNMDNGAVLLLLTQEKEGFFTCSHIRSVSSNSIGLAGT